jgi:hypothetical protein
MTDIMAMSKIPAMFTVCTLMTDIMAMSKIPAMITVRTLMTDIIFGITNTCLHRHRGGIFTVSSYYGFFVLKSECFSGLSQAIKIMALN